MQLGIIDIGRPLFTVIADEVNFVTQNSDSSLSFAYLFGTGFSYQLNDKLDFLINTDSLGVKPTFNVVETSNVGPQGNSIFSQEVSSLNISAIIAIKL